MTKLTASLTAGNQADLETMLAHALGAGAEAVEVRLDYLASPIDFKAVVDACNVPIVWTNRHVDEGGRFRGSEDERIGMLLDAIEAGGRYIDIEFMQWRRQSDVRKCVAATLDGLRQRGRDIRLILSFHDFQRVPKNAGETLALMADAADVVKFAFMAGDAQDSLAVIDLARSCPNPVIALAMGEAGQCTRVLAKKLGCEISFASVSAETASAPGQLTIDEARRVYNWDRIDPSSRVFGVVGHPVAHSLSPAIQNTAYRAMDFNGVYVKFDVAPTYEAFEQFVDAARADKLLDLGGLSVTIPHKVHAIDYVRRRGGTVDDLAAKIGAVNTLVFDREGSVAGYNTDYVGVLSALETGAGLTREALASKHVAVFGAGGVARAIVGAISACGADVTIYNRTRNRADALAGEFDCRVADWDDRQMLSADLVINGTSIGLHAHPEHSPLDDGVIRDTMVVFDTVYNPLETALLAQARQAGATAIDGAWMLVYQAVAQIELWFAALGLEKPQVPAEAMREVMLRELGGM